VKVPRNNREDNQMQEEELLLKQRDRDFLKALHAVRKGHITQRQAVEQLKVTLATSRAQAVCRVGFDGRQHGLLWGGSNDMGGSKRATRIGRDCLRPTGPTNGRRSGRKSWQSHRSGARCGSWESVGSPRDRRRPRGLIERFFKTAQDRLRGIAP
jgi:hypothetical protein